MRSSSRRRNQFFCNLKHQLDPREKNGVKNQNKKYLSKRFNQDFLFT